MGKRIIKLSLKEIPNRTLNLGFTGENVHSVVAIDCTEIFSDYPDAEVVLKAKPGSGEIYEPEIDVAGGVIIWSVLTTDLAKGSGQYQLTFTNGTEVIKSEVGSYVNNASLPNP